MARDKFAAAMATNSHGAIIKAESNPISVYNQDHMLVVGDYDHLFEA